MDVLNGHAGKEICYYLKEGALDFGLNLSEEQTKLFIHYYYLLKKANERVNLTHIIDPKDVAIKHFLDSLSCVAFFNFNGVKNVIDVGTGAGFPGIPVKIFLNNIELTLLDSSKKRTQFLNSVIDSLFLKNVDVYHERAEIFGHKPGNRERYSLCFSRAVSSLRTLVELCLPLVMVGGRFLALKGPSVENEVEEAKNGVKILGGEIQEIKKFNLPFSGDGRSIIVIGKINNTPGKYPRRAGIPSKRPL